MIHLITTVDSTRMLWLYQFIEHYKELGVERFHITSHVSPSLSSDKKDSIYSQTERILKSIGVMNCYLLECDFDAMNIRTHHDTIQAKIDTDDWIIWADIDEFQQYWQPLKKIISECENESFNIVGGYFLDRVTESGHLAEFDPHKPIWHQYPVGCDITKKILLGQTNKVVASKAYVKIKHANHDPLKEQMISWHPQRATVHHFKWDASVLDRLQFRLSKYWREKCHWWVQSERFYHHIDQFGKINLKILQTSLPTFKTSHDQNHHLVA